MAKAIDILGIHGGVLKMCIPGGGVYPGNNRETLPFYVDNTILVEHACSIVNT